MIAGQLQRTLALELTEDTVQDRKLANDLNTIAGASLHSAPETVDTLLDGLHVQQQQVLV